MTTPLCGMKRQTAPSAQKKTVLAATPDTGNPSSTMALIDGFATSRFLSFRGA